MDGPLTCQRSDWVQTDLPPNVSWYVGAVDSLHRVGAVIEAESQAAADATSLPYVAWSALAAQHSMKRRS